MAEKAGPVDKPPLEGCVINNVDFQMEKNSICVYSSIKSSTQVVYLLGDRSDKEIPIDSERVITEKCKNDARHQRIFISGGAEPDEQPHKGGSLNARGPNASNATSLYDYFLLPINDNIPVKYFLNFYQCNGREFKIPVYVYPNVAFKVAFNSKTERPFLTGGDAEDRDVSLAFSVEYSGIKSEISGGSEGGTNAIAKVVNWFADSCKYLKKFTDMVKVLDTLVKGISLSKYADIGVNSASIEISLGWQYFVDDSYSLIGRLLTISANFKPLIGVGITYHLLPIATLLGQAACASTGVLAPFAPFFKLMDKVMELAKKMGAEIFVDLRIELNINISGTLEILNIGGNWEVKRSNLKGGPEVPITLTAGCKAQGKLSTFKVKSQLSISAQIGCALTCEINMERGKLMFIVGFEMLPFVLTVVSMVEVEIWGIKHAAGGEIELYSFPDDKDSLKHELLRKEISL